MTVDGGTAHLDVHYLKKLTGGNRYAQGGERSVSMQGCYSSLRPLLVGALCHDIDMVNSIPNLLVQFLQKPHEHGCVDLMDEDFAAIQHYVQKRDEWLRGIMEFHRVDRDAAKELVLRVMYGGSCGPWLREFTAHREVYEPVAQLERSMRVVRDKVLSSPKWAHVLEMKRRQDRGDEQSCRRSAFSIVTQELQDRALGEIDRSFQEQGWRVPSLIFDVLHVNHREDADLEAAMRVAERHVFERTSYGILLLEKPLYGLQDASIQGLT